MIIWRSSNNYRKEVIQCLIVLSRPCWINHLAAIGDPEVTGFTPSQGRIGRPGAAKLLAISMEQPNADTGTKPN